MKKILLFILITIALLFIINPLKISASINISGNDAIKSYENLTTKNIAGVAKLNTATFNTYNGGNKSKLDGHQTSWVEPNLPIKSSDMRVVCYASGTPTMWKGGRPSELAKAFEKENPGWIVVAGINGDFFHIDDNCEPCGTFMQEGSFMKSYAYFSEGAIGFRNDGSYIYGFTESASSEVLQILKDDGSYETIKNVEYIDPSSVNNIGINLFTRFSIVSNPYISNTFTGTINVDLTSAKVVRIKYDLQRMERDLDRIYLDGTVDEILTDLTSLEIDDNKQYSYLVSKDGSLDSLTKGQTIRVTAAPTGNWSDVDNIIGVFGHILDNGTVLPHDEKELDYVNCVKNRTVVGMKEDGTPIIMVIEKHSYGASYLEAAQILKSVGCTNGYLLDGGGSSCIFVRNMGGSFTLINQQQDGSERRDANAVFFVVRDPGFKVMATNVKRTSVDVDLSVTNQTTYDTLSNIKVNLVLNNKVLDTKEYKGETLTFTNLTEETDYEITVDYDIPSYEKASDKVQSGAYTSFTTPAFVYPNPKLSATAISDTEIKITRDMTIKEASWFKNIVVHLGDDTFSMGDKESIICDQLFSDTEYELFYEYTIADPETGNTYYVNTESVNNPTVKTLAYKLPTIDKFVLISNDNGHITLEYAYSDPDRIVQKGILKVDGVEVETIKAKKGTFEIDVDPTKQHEIVFVLDYKYEEQSFTIDSTKLTIEATSTPAPTPAPTEEPEPTKKKKCGKKNAELIISLISLSTLLMFIIRKKH